MLRVSVIVVCLNEAEVIGRALNSLVKQDYPSDLTEIIVVDGNSTDGTLDIVREFEKSHGVRLVVEPRKGTALGRNVGVAAASHDHIGFIDGDCEAPTNWLSILMQAMEEAMENDASVIAVGGANIPPEKASPFVRAIGVAQDSFAGAFNSAQGRQFEASRLVPSLANCNVVYQKQAILDVNGFDETLMSEAEDADLNYRIGVNGGKFLFVPESYVLHWMRATPRLWWKNMVRYGKGRARLLKRFPEMWSVSYSLPLIFLTGMLTIPLAQEWPVFALGLLYFPAVLGYSYLLSARKKVPELFLHVFTVFLVQHFGYAFGEAWGLLNPEVK
ncbi:glycosyltransferase [Pseudodesulfovibrio sp.]|nr:glycosyltransferase [Pseudodesulfovibrio sp.]